MLMFMRSHLVLASLTILSALVVVASLIWYFLLTPSHLLRTFEECVAAGHPILESYPARCLTDDGQSFVQDIGNELEKTDLIRVSAPRPTATVGDPITISGEARGFWFFEASFPIHLEDKSGQRLTTTIATAQGEWMTEDFVPFQATLDIPASVSGPLILVFEKDNPSGLPEHDDALRMPIIVTLNEE